LWSTGSVNNRIVIDQPGEYKLQVTDANGCVGTDSITLFKKECMNGIYIPTAFTPGNDGKNDLFKALVFGKVVSFKLQVFDRAGQLIFQTTDPRKGWDGSNSGISYSTSVFVWQCFYQLDQQQPTYQKGTVTIVR
ncbi:MAG: T9SS type B sorting domain-containing protein, partial [Chitinophagaceae bacterium]